MLKVFVACALGISTAALGWSQAAVHVKTPEANGTRALQGQTASAAIRNYLQAWDGLRSALGQNRADLLDRDFIGTAKDKISATVQQQASLGLRANYEDRSHEIQIVFYSPDGMSLELTDDVEYDVQILDHDKPVGSQHVRTRYVAVMTPTETKWRVRLFQALPE